jgi:hypothetical protein
VKVTVTAPSGCSQLTDVQLTLASNVGVTNQDVYDSLTVTGVGSASETIYAYRLNQDDNQHGVFCPATSDDKYNCAEWIGYTADLHESVDNSIYTTKVTLTGNGRLMASP